MKTKFIRKTQFRLFSWLEISLRACRKFYWSLRGVTFGKGTFPGKLTVNWPHQLRIGSESILEDHLIFKYDGIEAPGPSIRIGNKVFLGNHCEFNISSGITLSDHCLIASGCKFIDHDHNLDSGHSIGEIPGPESEILIGANAWLGVNVVVLKGVILGEGCVVGAGSVVTRSIPPFEIWAGIPARKIGVRK